MRFIKHILASSPLSLALLGVFLLGGCATYTIPNEDGIYAKSHPNNRTQERTKVQNNSNSGNNEYEEYFAKQNSKISQAQRYMFGEAEEEVFTDIDDYSSPSSPNNTTPYADTEDYYEEFDEVAETPYTTGNASWGANPATINVNYYSSPFYGNPYIYRGYYAPRSWGGFYNPWSYYPSYYWGGGYLSYNFGFGFGHYYGGFYRPFHYYSPYGHYYNNPYYAYSQPRSYHYGRRGYRSSQRANTNRRVSTRSTRKQNNRRSARSSKNNTRRSAKATASRRSQNSQRKARATTTRRRKASASSHRIRNPKDIRAGASRRSTNNARRKSTRRSNRNVYKNSSRRTNSSTKARRSSSRTRTRAHSTPSRRSSSSSSVRRSSPSRSSGGSRSTGGGSRRR